MGKALTEELIKMKTRQDSLGLIRNLNLWGQDIDDLKVLKIMPNLEVLSLSVNKIYTLKDISHCMKLKELYLRKNAIENISEIKHLTNLTELKVLWLSDNPCANLPNYREIVLNALPKLEKLDNLTISNEDRIQASHVQSDFNNDNSINNSKTVNYKNTNSSQYNNNNNQQIISKPLSNKSNNIIESSSQSSQQQQLHQQQQQQSQQYPSSYNQENQLPKQSIIPTSTVAYQVSSGSNYARLNEEDQQQSMMNLLIDLQNPQQELTVNKNSNIVCSIMYLLKELDLTSLEVIRRDMIQRVDEQEQ